jgi:L-ascorbate 6-phosphate lactonase
MPTGKPLIEQVHRTPILPNSLAIWGLGQMGIIIKGIDGVLVIDPYLSGDVGNPAENWWARAFPPPLQPTEMTGINYYLITHEHGDHLDGQAVAGAAKASPEMKFIVNGWCVEKMAKADVGDDRLIIPQALEPIMLPGTSARITVTPSAHYEKTHDSQKGYRWVGYWIEWNGVTLYHSGDTIIYPGYIDTLRDLPRADVAMIPVNGRDWYRETTQNVTGNLLPEEAAQLTNELGWDVVIPGHNDLFPNNTIPNSQIIDGFDRFAPRQKLKFLQPGELYYYVK